MPMSVLQKAAGALAGSFLLARGRRLFAENQRDWEMPLSKFGKLQAGGWLILDDYSKGVFPPRFLDQQKAYQAEKDYRFVLPGLTGEDVARSNMTKPFWFGAEGRKLLRGFNRLCLEFERLGIAPPASILELGCGGGWMSEMLAIMGFDVCGSTLSEDDVRDANLRVKSLEVKGLTPKLRFVAAPMETVHQAVPPGAFDAAFVFEALHHAFDWRETIRSSHPCLKPGGWLLLCNEPNVLHTCVSYRMARLSNTHEIGMSKRELIAQLQKTGFRKIVYTGSKLHCWFRPHWLAAQK